MPFHSQNLKIRKTALVLAAIVLGGCKPISLNKASSTAAENSGIADQVRLDETSPNNLFTLLPPLRCDILERVLQGRQNTYSCAVRKCNPGDSVSTCEFLGKKTECRPGTHYSVWKNTAVPTGRGSEVESYEFKPDVYVAPLDVEDAVRGKRMYWVNYAVQPIKENIHRRLGAAGYLCVPVKSGPQSLSREQMGDVTTLSMMAGAAEADYGQLVMVTRMVPGVAAAIEIDMCRAGELSCWEAAFTTATTLVDFALPVGMVVQGAARSGKLGVQLAQNLSNVAKIGRKVTIAGNVAAGNIRAGQALYLGANGEGLQAIFMGADAVLRFTTAGVLSLRSVARVIDDFGGAASKATNASKVATIASETCLGLSSGACDIGGATYGYAMSQVNQMANRPNLSNYRDLCFEAWKNGPMKIYKTAPEAYDAIDKLYARRLAVAYKNAGGPTDVEGFLKNATKDPAVVQDEVNSIAIRIKKLLDENSEESLFQLDQLGIKPPIK